MPSRTTQATKSPRVVKQEITSPKTKSSGTTITTPKVTIKKTPKSEPKTPVVAPAASSSSSPPIEPKRKSARKSKVEKEQIKGILKKESIRKTARISGCTRIGSDIYEKARSIFDSQLGELLKRASIITLYAKKKQITYQIVNKCAKDLWNINVYNGINTDDVKAIMSTDDYDYKTGSEFSDDE